MYLLLFHYFAGQPISFWGKIRCVTDPEVPTVNRYYQILRYLQSYARLFTISNIEQFLWNLGAFIKKRKDNAHWAFAAAEAACVNIRRGGNETGLGAGWFQIIGHAHGAVTYKHCKKNASSPVWQYLGFKVGKKWRAKGLEWEYMLSLPYIVYIYIWTGQYFFFN